MAMVVPLNIVLRSNGVIHFHPFLKLNAFPAIAFDQTPLNHGRLTFSKAHTVQVVSGELTALNSDFRSKADGQTRAGGRIRQPAFGNLAPRDMSQAKIVVLSRSGNDRATVISKIAGQNLEIFRTKKGHAADCAACYSKVLEAQPAQDGGGSRGKANAPSHRRHLGVSTPAVLIRVAGRLWGHGSLNGEIAQHHVVQIGITVDNGEMFLRLRIQEKDAIPACSSQRRAT